MSLRQKFERVRNYWNEKCGSWLAIDFEEWERDSTVLTEFGWSCLEFKNGEEHQTDGHHPELRFRQQRDSEQSHVQEPNLRYD